MFRMLKKEKFQVYILYVTWSDDSTNVIYRRYSRFFDFQSRLMEMFPEEAGVLDPEKRIIPFLPGKKFFGRSHIREVALKRMGPIAEYCKAIVKLPRKISQCRDVFEFFELDPDDINPPKGRKQSVKAQKISNPKPVEVYLATSEYRRQEKGEVSLQVGMEVEVVEKTLTGWWFVNVDDEQGWVPSTCLARGDGVKEDTTERLPPGQEEQYLCTEEFKAQSADELSMERGAVVDVVEKNFEGWWIVRYGGQEGYVPATYLIKAESFKVHRKGGSLHRPGKGGSTPQTTQGPQSSTPQLTQGPQIVKSLHEISDLLKGDRPPSSIISSTLAPATTDQDPTEEYIYHDDTFDDDYAVPDEDKIYTIQELSQILKDDRRGSAQTEEVYESIRNLKSRSLQRCGSSRPPPRPANGPSPGGVYPKSERPVLKRQPTELREYITVAPFSDPVGDGISFEQGQIVKVLEKSENGWWFISIEGTEGWAPATYIEEVTPITDKPRAPSPARNIQESNSLPAESAADQDPSSRRLSAVETLGGLANALKSKIQSKGNKSPPTPPKKDFLNVESDSQPSPGRVKPQPVLPVVSKATKIVLISPSERPVSSISGKPGVKSLPDRSISPTERPVSSISGKLVIKSHPDRSMQPPPPPPPVKHTSEQKPVPVPPAKPQSNLSSPPQKDCAPTNAQVSSNRDQKVATLAAPSRQALGVKPAPPPAERKPQVEEKSAGVKPPLPAKMKPHGEDKTAGLKPSLPINKPVLEVARQSAAIQDSGVGRKSGLSRDSDSVVDQAQINFSQLADALKAKLETKRESVGQDTSVKPTPPVLTKKPPGFGVKSSEFGTKTPISKSNIQISRSCENLVENEVSSASENDLANVLKARFEKRQQAGDVSASNPLPDPNNTKDISPAKAVLKPTSKPARPITPPTPKKGDAMERPRPGIPAGKKTYDPQKYSTRPLPPSPNAPVLESSKPRPSVPLKPASKPLLNVSSETASENEGKVGSYFLNALKNRLGEQNNYITPTEHVSNAQTVETPKIEVSDVRNNNSVVKRDSKELTYMAIANYDGSSPGEMQLVVGEHYELLDTSNGWWLVSSRGSEGWAPETYLEPVASAVTSVQNVGNKGQAIDGGRLTSVQNVGNKEQSMEEDGCSVKGKKELRICSDFQAENDGELSVFSGEVVQIMEDADNGWCFVQTANGDGWVPTAYITSE
ncbi:SH3 and PX domain-containing protein 2A-like isoform X2 [Dreissena polymorpha]|uniref:SH3 and PX domain-containing protein 2A-like isoform X2 n=1 Tax=Dreissena polymorpha TaxID=45954 RepID=UPI0022643AA7|nr:SH3 and PX domain-containing protein 2A-like isoform X2 [Dreissena polymorpha]